MDTVAAKCSDRAVFCKVLLIVAGKELHQLTMMLVLQLMKQSQVTMMLPWLLLIM